MSLLSLTVYRMDSTTPEQALAMLKTTALDYIAYDLQDTVYLLNQAASDEILVLGSWPSLEAYQKAAAFSRRSKALNTLPGLTRIPERHYFFSVVKDFRRFHLTAQTTSILLYRLIKPGLTIEKAMEEAKIRAKHKIFVWPGLVQYRLGRALNNQPLLLMRNDWVSAQSRLDYLLQRTQNHRAWLKRVGLENLYEATTLLDFYKPPPATPKPSIFIP